MSHNMLCFNHCVWWIQWTICMDVNFVQVPSFDCDLCNKTVQISTWISRSTICVLCDSRGPATRNSQSVYKNQFWECPQKAVSSLVDDNLKIQLANVLGRSKSVKTLDIRFCTDILMVDKLCIAELKSNEVLESLMICSGIIN